MSFFPRKTEDIEDLAPIKNFIESEAAWQEEGKEDEEALSPPDDDDQRSDLGDTEDDEINVDESAFRGAVLSPHLIAGKTGPSRLTEEHQNAIREAAEQEGKSILVAVQLYLKENKTYDFWNGYLTGVSTRAALDMNGMLNKLVKDMKGALKSSERLTNKANDNMATLFIQTDKRNEEMNDLLEKAALSSVKLEKISDSLASQIAYTKPSIAAMPIISTSVSTIKSIIRGMKMGNAITDFLCDAVGTISAPTDIQTVFGNCHSTSDEDQAVEAFMAYLINKRLATAEQLESLSALP